jgi:ethanolamine permease
MRGRQQFAGWQAQTLGLTVPALAVFHGIAALIGALVMLPVVFALTRLRAAAPTAATTSDLIATTVAPRVAAWAGWLQAAAYTLLTFNFASGLGFLLCWLILEPQEMTNTWWAVLTWAAIAVVALLTWPVPLRWLVTVAGVLVAAAVLIWFYLALAILARVASGTDPVAVGDVPAPVGFDAVATLLPLTLTVLGFEAVTAANRHVRSVGVPMAVGLAVVAALAMLVWSADHFGYGGGFRFGAEHFGDTVLEYFGSAGSWWLTTAAIAAHAAGLMLLMTLAARVAHRQLETTLEVRLTWLPFVLVVCVVAALTVLLINNWDVQVRLVALILLLAMYQFVALAFSRASGNSTAAWWTRVALAALLGAVILLPLLDTGFEAHAVLPLVVTAVLVAAAYGLSLVRPMSEAPPPGSPAPPAPSAHER